MRRQIYSLVPFEDDVYVFDIDTQRVKDIIESEIAYWGEDFPISGVKIFYDPEYAAGGKVVGLAIESAKPVIRAAASEYSLLKMKLSTWDGVYNIKATGATIYDLIIENLARQPKLAYDARERYVVRKSQVKREKGKVNVNQANQRELVSLPFIGPILAKRIIDYRTKNGPFHSLVDLHKVKGIGERQIEKLKDLVEF